MAKKNNFRIIIAGLMLLKKHPKFIIPVIFLSVAFYAYEITIGRPNASYMGVPQAEKLNINTFARVFRNSDFMIGYSDYRGNPLWVTYPLTKIAQDSRGYKRPSSFRKDWRNITGLKHQDYTGSGYDRGHMAPNYAISRLYGREAQMSTFLMTNITPQRPRLNQKLWQRLEDIEANEFPKYFDKVWVITGPIFDERIQKLKSSSYVEIPDAFYKVYIGIKDKEKPKSLAFIMPQNVKGNESLMRFVASIDEVEEKIGFDFFPKLDSLLEKRLEASKETEVWKLKSLANRPSRY